MGGIFHALLYKPLFNALVLLYKTAALNDFGLAIIMLTVVIRLIFYPLFYKTYRNQTIMQKLQPAVRKIQHDHKHNRERQAQELLALYREHKVNPFSSLFLIFIQLPILIALYRVFYNGFAPEAWQNLYDFIAPPGNFTSSFLGLIDLSKRNIIMVGLAALAQYFQGRLSLPKKPGAGEVSQAEQVGRRMLYIAPMLTLILFYTLPSAIGLYWLVTSLFSILQQILINRSLNKKNGETAVAIKKTV